MKRLLSIILLLWVGLPAQAAPGESRRFPAQATRSAELRIQGSTDIEVFARVIADYQRLHPGTEVVYEDVTAQRMYVDYLRRGRAAAPDLLISSGMDLQTRLVNDGHALPHRTPSSLALPHWAHWRHEVIAIGYEPVVIVYNTRRLPAARVPRSRSQLLALLQAGDAPLRGRVGTYDAARSSVGYLFASQDTQLGSMAGALLAALGDNRVRLEDQTGVLLDRVGSGELLLAYNVVGSYAQARIAQGAPLGVVQPEDYTLLMLRTAVIPREAPHVGEAHRFLDYLLSPRGQRVLAQQTHLQPVIPAGVPRGQAPGGTQRPIPLGPGLLVYLDSMKRRQFLAAWRANMQPPAPAP